MSRKLLVLVLAFVLLEVMICNGSPLSPRLSPRLDSPRGVGKNLKQAAAPNGRKDGKYGYWGPYGYYDYWDPYGYYPYGDYYWYG